MTPVESVLVADAILAAASLGLLPIAIAALIWPSYPAEPRIMGVPAWLVIRASRWARRQALVAWPEGLAAAAVLALTILTLR